jgi:LysR family hydrogen peroxide-inducible transcriptional activator
MRDLMTFQELRFLVALAQHRHFGHASQSVHVSQPTLSIAIKKLEEELGVVIFERNKNDVRITPLGKEIVKRAKHILTEVEGIKEIAKSDQDQLSGVLKLGAIYTIGPYLLPSLIMGLNKIAPGLPIEIQEDFTGRLKEKLLAGEVDAIIISLPFSVPGISTQVLYKEPFVVTMPKEYPLAKQKVIDERTLSQHNILLLGEGHCFRDQIIASCPACFSFESHSKVNWRTVEGSSLETIRHMVAAKMGLTILPILAAEGGLAANTMLTTRPLKGQNPSRTVALAWRASFPRVKAIEILLKAIFNSQLPGVKKVKIA